MTTSQRLDLTAPDVTVIANPGDEHAFALRSSIDLTDYEITGTWRTNRGVTADVAITVTPDALTFISPPAADGTLRVVLDQDGDHQRTLYTVRVRTP